MGDRECPACAKLSLIESGVGRWACQHPDCKEEYTDEELDADVEVDD